MSRGFFVTGTDTGVGKTFVACTLIHALRARGLRVHPMKPVAAGATRHGDGWANEDTLALAAAAGPGAPAREAITPVLLHAALAPHIAARRERTPIAIDALAAAHARLGEGADLTLVEGVGGFLVPLGPAGDARDLAVALGLPVILVVGLRLGCLNHALLTAEAIARAGLPLAGWVANLVDPGMQAVDENVAALAERLPAPTLGFLPHARGVDPRILAPKLDVAPLLEATA